jgi:hypothetical protein
MCVIDESKKTFFHFCASAKLNKAYQNTIFHNLKLNMVCIINCNGELFDC